MVSIIENYATAEGIVRSVSENEKMPGYHIIQLELTKSATYRAYPNLAKMDEGKLIQINIKSCDLEEKNVVKDEKLKSVIRKAQGQVYFMK